MLIEIKTMCNMPELDLSLFLAITFTSSIIIETHPRGVVVTKPHKTVNPH